GRRGRLATGRRWRRWRGRRRLGDARRRQRALRLAAADLLAQAGELRLQPLAARPLLLERAERLQPVVVDRAGGERSRRPVPGQRAEEQRGEREQQEERRGGGAPDRPGP